MREVGEYVRTKDKILKIDSFDKDIRNIDCVCFTTGEVYTQELLNEIMVKHSKNIIDLISDTDILKVEINEEWVDKEESIKFIIVGQTYTIDEIKKDLENGIYKIKQILTKEQYDANCYKVKEE